MVSNKRFSTKYPGVYYRIRNRIDQSGEEKVYYAVYKKDGKAVETKLGRQYQDDMTPARANSKRVLLMTGKEKTLKEKREQSKEKKWTLNNLWQEYRSTKPDNKSMIVDGNRYEKHVKKYVGKKTPSELVPGDIENIKKRLKNKSPQTQKHVVHLVKRVCNFGMDNALCPGPNFKIKAPLVNNKVTETLSKDELKRLLAVLDNYSNRQVANLLKLAMATGMRRGELFKLEWTDINFDIGIIHLRDPKGKTDVYLPMNEWAESILKEHERTDSPLVFPGQDGKQRATIQQASKDIREKAGLPANFRMCHGLRHFYATTLVNSGVDLYAVQKLLGHKNPTTTARYAHLRSSTLRDATNNINHAVNFNH